MCTWKVNPRNWCDGNQNNWRRGCSKDKPDTREMCWFLLQALSCFPRWPWRCWNQHCQSGSLTPCILQSGNWVCSNSPLFNSDFFKLYIVLLALITDEGITQKIESCQRNAFHSKCNDLSVEIPLITRPVSSQVQYFCRTVLGTLSEQMPLGWSPTNVAGKNFLFGSRKSPTRTGSGSPFWDFVGCNQCGVCLNRTERMQFWRN